MADKETKTEETKTEETKTEETKTEETKTEETKTEEPKKANKAKAPERVEVFIPRGAANDDPNLFVSVNGTNYLLPRGKTSKVPSAVAKEIERAQRAQNKQDDRIDEMTTQASK